MHEFWIEKAEWTLGGGPLERTFANHTHIIVSLLKARKEDSCQKKKFQENI